jgi:predicted dehydrogenase
MGIKPVKMGIISYGHYFRTNFVRHLSNCSSVEIVGVYNRREERRNQAKEDGYWVTGDLDELLAREDIEAVAIGSSNAAHREQSIRSAEAGKHIICEKPLALDLKDIDEMVAAVEKKKLINHVNHPGPYSDRFCKLRDLVNQYGGKIFHCWIRTSRLFGLWNQGARHVAVANPEESGGWTFHHLCHALDEVCILLGSSKATKVYHINQKSCNECPSEEMVNSFIHFDAGATALLTDGTSIGGFSDMGVQCERADFRVFKNTLTAVIPGPHDPTGRPGNLSQQIKTFGLPDEGKMIETVGHKFAQAVRGGQNDLLTFRFVSNQYRIMNAMQESAKTGRVIDLE